MLDMAKSFHTDARQGHQQRNSIHWWVDGVRSDEKTLARLVTDFQLLITDDQRLQAYQTYASLYTNRRVELGVGILSGYNNAPWAIKRGKYSRIPYNLMKIVIDEATSRITKSQPRAKFMTVGGNRQAKAKADMMERWNDGEVQKLRQDETFDAIAKDACQYGLGAMKHMKAYRESRLQTMRTYPGNLFVDLEETLFENPQRLHERRFVSKTMLKAMFPKFRQQIDDSDQISSQARDVTFYGDFMGAQDMVELVESWHLPSFVEGKGASAKSPDGVRFLWINGAILQYSAWNRRQFPFSFFNWKRDPHNTFFGIGLAEDLLGVHVDANVTLHRVNNAIEKIANPHIVTKKGSNVSKAALGNEAGSIWEYSGNTPPTVVLPAVVPKDLLMYVQQHKEWAYQIAGMSASSTSGGGVPASLQTGKAVENYIAAESVPFNEQLRKFENFAKHVAENNVAVGREIFEQDPSYSVVMRGEKNTIEEIKWEDVALDPDEERYVIRVAPTSSLSETPAARLAEIKEMAAMGMISDPATMRDLYNISDVESYDDYITAAKRNVERMIDLALDRNVFSPPMPKMDLQYFIIRAAEAEQKAYAYEEVPEQNIATLRRMGRRAEELVQRQMAQAQANAAGLISPTQPAQDPTSGVQPNAIQQDVPG